jgi:hypothetical protein
MMKEIILPFNVNDKSIDGTLIQNQGTGVYPMATIHPMKHQDAIIDRQHRIRKSRERCKHYEME